MSTNTNKELPHHKSSWSGYTLDEMRYMRAYTVARLEINRERLQQNLAGLKSFAPGSKSGIVGKILGTLSYLDIAMITFRVGSKALRAVRFLRGRR